MATSLGFDSAESVRGAAPLVLVIAASLSARHGGTRRSDISMQGYRFFVQTDDRFCGIIRAFIDFQHIFHILDVFIVEIGDTPDFFPPRLEVVVQQQNPYRFSANSRD